MSRVREEADWIRLCDSGELRDDQRVLLETALVACNPEAVVTRHVVGSQTAITSIARAHSALESRGRPDRVKPQPYQQSTFGLVSAARAMLETTRPVFSPGVLNGAIDTLKDIEAGGLSGLKDPVDCAVMAARLATEAVTVRTAVADRFAAAWRGAAAASIPERLALEMAACLVMEGRGYSALLSDVRTALRRGPVDADRLLEVLLPAERAFGVAVVVEGTSGLDGVAGLMNRAAAAEAIAPGEPVVGWGRCTADLKALADLADVASATRRSWSGVQSPGHVLLTFTVHAHDLVGAALVGRRQVSELLDQYVAGQRVAEIRVRPETVACDLSSGRRLRLAIPILGSGPVRPLTTEWPPALRESLRTAHIARVTEAPMAAAGLCWTALEALEVKPDGTAKLARALSLQATRQQVVDLHRQIRTAVAATVRAAHDALHATQSLSDQLGSAADAAIGEQAAALAERAAAARASAAERRVALERACEAETLHAAVEAWIGVGDDGKLRDPNRWLDVLAAPAEAKPDHRAAADTLAALADCIVGEAGARLRTWRALLAAPDLLADWIEDTEMRFKTSLDWLYALRNTALHDGRFASATDMLDVHTGRALVDLTLEVLGNWFGHAANAQQQTAWPAITIIDHLADRQQTVTAKLRGGTLTGLNVTHLTSSTSTGLDRTRSTVHAERERERPPNWTSAP